MPDTPAPARLSNGRFGAGNPGRRAGARNQVSHRVAMAILEDFELHKEQVLDMLRRTYAPAYFAVLTRLLDRQLLLVEPPMADEGPDIEVLQPVGLSQQAPRSEEDRRAAVARLELALGRRAGLVPASGHRINGD
jgi:hypothetical protein